MAQIAAASRANSAHMHTIPMHPLLRSAEGFVAMMDEKFDGSNYPKRLDEALPFNMRCGIFEEGAPAE